MKIIIQSWYLTATSDPICVSRVVYGVGNIFAVECFDLRNERTPKKSSETEIQKIKILRTVAR